MEEKMILKKTRGKGLKIHTNYHQGLHTTIIHGRGKQKSANALGTANLKKL